MFTPHTTTAEHVGNRAIVAAAVAAGRAAWEAGQNVEAALTAAGYARYVVDGALSYFNSEGFEEAPPPLARAISASQPEMSSSSGARSKRGRFTVPVSKSVKKYVKTAFDRLQDDKYNSAVVTDGTASAAGTVVGGLLPGIQQGTTDTTRIGNHIRVKHITVYGNFGDTIPNRGRVLILWDRQPNGALPAFGEIITSPSVDGQYNHDTVVGCGGQRFTVLYDNRFVVNPNITATNKQAHWQYKNHRVNKVVTFDGNTGLIGDMVSNNLIVAYISANATLDIAFNYEVCFTDA